MLLFLTNFVILYRSLSFLRCSDKRPGQEKHTREVNQVGETERELRRKGLVAKCPPQGEWPS